jgi:hypothetical protein
MSIEKYREEIINELLKIGCDDLVHIADLIWLASSIGGESTSEGIKRTVIDLISVVLEKELMVIGDVSNKGFSEWGIALDKVVDQIEYRWSALTRDPLPGDICWLAITSKGRGLWETELREGQSLP